MITSSVFGRLSAAAPLRRLSAAAPLRRLSAAAPLRRLSMTAGIALVVGAPIIVTLMGIGGAGQPSTPLASCPGNEVLDPTSGACRPATDVAPTTFSPINPEKEPLQPGSITSSDAGEVGQLPEVNGIPCNGGNTGLCIGLQEQNAMLGERPGTPGVPG